MGKVEKLNKDIQRLENRILLIEGDMDKAKQNLRDKVITKAEFTTLKQKHTQRTRDIKTSIARKEKARLIQEKKLREKAEKRAEKMKRKEA